MQQLVSVSLPLRHPLHELPRHVRRDALSPRPLGIVRLAQHLALDDVEPVDNGRIGAGRELDGRRRDQRELDVRRLRPRIGLGLFRLLGEVYGLFVQIIPARALAALQVDLVAPDNVTADLYKLFI